MDLAHKLKTALDESRLLILWSAGRFRVPVSDGLPGRGFRMPLKDSQAVHGIGLLALMMDGWAF